MVTARLPNAEVDALPAAVRREYPFTPYVFAATTGARMSYLDEGPRDAPVVLMVHGNPSWSFLYRSLVLGLRDRFRCIVPDHLGCGLSAKPQAFDYHLGVHIGHLGQLLDTLRVHRAHLVVHDWGGPIGLGAARRRPDFVDRIVVLNTGAFPSRHIPKRIAVCRLPWIGALLVRGLNGFSGAAVRMAVERPLSDGARRAYLWPHRSWADRVAVREFVRDIPLGPGHRTQPEIEAIAASLEGLRKRPGLIVWGGRDWCFDDVFLDEWKRRLPEARVVRLPDAGHWLLEDDPQTVLREVSGFLG
ncbi:alpha/beta fold hydrolase [Opitutales bacterium ASA1]|uniref:alpha/beta fold hydrolase n=1 Tax=Congregicoccus parvus TaxID=3081749 RepID=UPI002B2C4C11|nr:alpha/beta fold hydrolase [Opitutales bacterium ASA1]